MNPIRVILVIVMCMLTVVGGYTLVASIVANSCSMFLAAGAIMCIAGVFCLIEDYCHKQATK